MMRIVVTGAGGFIGSRLAADLAGAGHDVTATWRRDHSRLGAAQSDRLSLVQLDVANRSAVEQLFKAQAFDAVVHCAARVARKAQEDAFAPLVADNVLASANLVDAVLSGQCRRFVFCSTISVYGDRGAPEGGYREADAAPNSAYGWTKRAGEELLDLAAQTDTALRAVSLRLAGVHGRGRSSGALHAMTSAALAGQPITVSAPESRFRWLFIDDLVRSVAACLDTDLPAGHRIVNLASADSFTLAELAERISDVSGSESTIKSATDAAPRNEVMNIERAQALLGFSPEPLDVALKAYIDALRRPE